VKEEEEKNQKNLTKVEVTRSLSRLENILSILSCVNFTCWLNVKMSTAKLAYNICGVLKVRLSQVTGENIFHGQSGRGESVQES